MNKYANKASKTSKAAWISKDRMKEGLAEWEMQKQQMEFPNAEPLNIIAQWDLLLWKAKGKGKGSKRKPGFYLEKAEWKEQYKKAGVTGLTKELELTFSYNYWDFQEGYASIRSCMTQNSFWVWDAYYPHNVGIWLLRENNNIVARSLGQQQQGQIWTYARAYGRYHWVLEGILAQYNVQHRQIELNPNQTNSLTKVWYDTLTRQHHKRYIYIDTYYND